MDPLSIIGLGTSVLGGVMSIFGASKAADRATEQLHKVQQFNRGQQDTFNAGMEDLYARQRAMPKYQADMTPYNALADKARMNEIQATGQTRMPGTQYALDQAEQGYANLVQSAGKIGGSRADLATTLLMGQQNLGAQKGATLAQGQQMMFQNQQQAKANTLNTLGQVAAAKSLEGLRMYQSEAANQQGLIGLMQQGLQGRTNLAQQGFQSEMTAQGIINQAHDQMWQGGAQTLGAIGGGLNALGMQNMKMDRLEKIMGKGKKTLEEVNSATSW